MNSELSRASVKLTAILTGQWLNQITGTLSKPVSERCACCMYIHGQMG